jgi:hypothetical protein
VLAEQPLHEPPDLRAEVIAHGAVLHHHERALLAHRRQRRGNLAADPRPADQDHALGDGGVVADRVRVAERAQVVHAVVVGPLHVAQPPHVRSGREQRATEPQLLPARQLRDALVRRQLHDALAREQLDGLLLVPPRRLEPRVLARRPPRQILLRQRRPIVGRVLLAANDHDRPVGPLGPQRLGAGGSGHAAADQQVVDVACGQLLR